MGTLAEIEAAVDALTQEQKEELFLATRLHAGTGELPPPREFTREQLERWITDDEAGYRRFLAINAGRRVEEPVACIGESVGRAEHVGVAVGAARRQLQPWLPHAEIRACGHRQFA